MLDREFEDGSFPARFAWEKFRRPLVLAPHPDDEVFGCGGLLALWSAAGVNARVMVLTDGEAQPGSATSPRRTESERAAEILGHEVRFAGLADRQLRVDDAFVQQVRAWVAETEADVVLCPGLHEPHPDHQATALATLWAVDSLQPRPDLCFYESGGALAPCTHLVDISAVNEQKQAALNVFQSQEDAQPYAARIASRDHFRATTLGHAAKAAEALQWFSLGGESWTRLAPFLQPLWMQQHLRALLPVQWPLVSIVIRTVGDARLPEAIGCALAQTHPRLEVVVASARARLGMAALGPWQSHARVRWVATEHDLNRPAAANHGMEHADGQFTLLLDEDDLIAPHHVQKLLSALQSDGTVLACHTDVDVVGADGRTLAKYDQPYNPQRLRATNVFPIHSVLFDRTLFSSIGCRFDESLPVLEDWDFWLQVQQHTGWKHVPGASATYRYHDRSGLEDPQHPHHHGRWRQQVLEKWLTRWTAHDVASTLTWYAHRADALAQQHRRVELMHSETVTHLNAERKDAQDRIDALLRASERLHQQLLNMEASRIWRYTRVLRWLRRWVAR